MTLKNTFPPVAVPLADFDSTNWRWPNFAPQELACKDGTILLHPASVDKLQMLRRRLGKTMIVNSAYRSPAYNKRVGGAAGSMHLAARAFDVRMEGQDPHEFERLARACGFTGFGFYPESGFMHIDTGPAREWGDRWPAFEDEKQAPQNPKIQTASAALYDFAPELSPPEDEPPARVKVGKAGTAKHKYA